MASGCRPFDVTYCLHSQRSSHFTFANEVTTQKTETVNYTSAETSLLVKSGYIGFYAYIAQILCLWTRTQLILVAKVHEIRDSSVVTIPGFRLSINKTIV